MPICSSSENVVKTLLTFLLWKAWESLHDIFVTREVGCLCNIFCEEPGTRPYILIFKVVRSRCAFLFWGTKESCMAFLLWGAWKAFLYFCGEGFESFYTDFALRKLRNFVLFLLRGTWEVFLTFLMLGWKCFPRFLRHSKVMWKLFEPNKRVRILLCQLFGIWRSMKITCCVVFYPNNILGYARSI